MEERIILVKNLIDYLYKARREVIYKHLRNRNYTVKEIEDSWEWLYRNDYITESETYDEWGEDESVLDDIIWHWYSHLSDKKGLLDVAFGIQQICCIFDDEVIKFSSTDVALSQNTFILSLPRKFQKLFCELEYIEEYKNICIYRQEKIDEDNEKDTYDTLSQQQISIVDNSHSWFTEELTSVLVRDYGYTQETFEELNKYLREAEEQTDFHNGNWGYDINCNPRIFDPLYIDC